MNVYPNCTVNSVYMSYTHTHLLQRIMYSTFNLHASSRLSVKGRTWRRELQHWNAGTMLRIWPHSLGEDSDTNATGALFK